MTFEFFSEAAFMQGVLALKHLGSWKRTLHSNTVCPLIEPAASIRYLSYQMMKLTNKPEQNDIIVRALLNNNDVTLGTMIKWVYFINQVRLLSEEGSYLR